VSARRRRALTRASGGTSELGTGAPAYMPWRAEFALLTVIWGSSFLCIKVAVDDLAAIDVALGRVALGAGALAVILGVTGDQLPRGRRVWSHLAVAGLFAGALPFALQCYGETHVSSVVAGLWNATMPLFVLIGATALLPDERPTSGRLIGFLAGFAGVVLIIGPWREATGGDLVGQLMFAAASASFGFGFPYIRRFLVGRPESGLSLTCGQLLCATAMLAVATLFAGGSPAGLGADAGLAMLWLGVLSTGVGFAINYDIVRQAGATTAAAITYVAPIVSTALGVIALGEGLSWNQPVGVAVVIGGVAFSERVKRGFHRNEQQH
jgi:drug/metabolite transporter (DMT)-like permease